MPNLISKIKRSIYKFAGESSLMTLMYQDYPAVKILFEQYGYEKTLVDKLPVAADGSPVPWYTYPAIEYFNQIDAKGLRIFEYGSGNSSLFWARKGAQVWSVEHDEAWHEVMLTKSSRLNGLLLRESIDEYASAIAEVGGLFDIIIIDGAWRNECASFALPFLRPSGLVILDNSDWYLDVAKFFQDAGYFQVDFNGFGPINNYCWTTSMLFPAQLTLSGRLGEPRPIGGIQVFKGQNW